MIYNNKQCVCTYLIRSGRRSTSFGCVCFSDLEGDKATVQHNISSVDSSTGCEGVFSSAIWNHILYVCVKGYCRFFFQLCMYEGCTMVIFFFVGFRFFAHMRKLYRNRGIRINIIWSHVNVLLTYVWVYTTCKTPIRT